MGIFASIALSKLQNGRCIKEVEHDVHVDGGKDAEFGSYYILEADFLVSATGQLNRPKLPDLPGLDEFKGKLLHTARWDWDYDLRGKKVAIIDNGATGSQLAPEIVKEVDSLTCYQRTPGWVIPRLDTPISAWKRALFKYIPYTRQRKRSDMIGFREPLHHVYVDEQHPMAQLARNIAIQHIQTQLPDRPDLWKKIQPQYMMGCKRVLVSDDFFAIFLRDNMKLETGKIDKITGKGIQTEGKEEECDLIICATELMATDFMYPINLTGSAGRTLSSV